MTMLSLDVIRDARWLTRQRALRWSFGLVAMSLILIGAHVIDHTRTGLINGSGEQLGVDFINYWSGARFGANGEAARAYDLAAFDEFQRSVIGPAAQFKMYVYPPVAMMLSLPLATLPFVCALIAWTALGAGFCLWSLARVIGYRLAALATFGAPAAFLNILTGQNGYFTAGLLGTGLAVLERRPILAGVLFGLLAYKSHLGVLLPLALILGGYWRTVAAAAATVAILLAS
ncbi:MAG TPA: glycosyltransferase family 87 protein, partial [Stellaceae bacterium]|nr:glycosyltransferase family 87 protein [Stellaceae bacterium]